MHLQILTPEKTTFDGEIDSVRVPGEAGSFEILNKHAPILASLLLGDVRIRVAGKDTHYHVAGGFIEFSHNKGVILADAAEKVGEIDLERAKAARERAEKRIRNTAHVDTLRAQKALMRALSRERFVEKFHG